MQSIDPFLILMRSPVVCTRRRAAQLQLPSTVDGGGERSQAEQEVLIFISIQRLAGWRRVVELELAVEW